MLGLEGIELTGKCYRVFCFLLDYEEQISREAV